MALSDVFAQDSELLYLQADDAGAAEADVGEPDEATAYGDYEMSKEEYMEKTKNDPLPQHDCPSGELVTFNKVFKGIDILWYSSLKNNAGYLSVAAFYVYYALMQVTRYRSASTFYDIGKLGDNSTNYWKLSDQVRLFGILGIFGTAFVTQLLSTLGIAAGVNLRVWIFVVGLGGAAVAMTVSILRLLGYNAAFTKYDDSTASAAVQTAAASTIAAFESDIFDDTVYDAAMMMVLYVNGPGWFLAQFEAFDADSQQNMLESYEESIERKKEEWAAEGAEGSKEEAEEEEEKSAYGGKQSSAYDEVEEEGEKAKED